MKRILNALLILTSVIVYSLVGNNAYAALCELTSPLATLNITDDITLTPAEVGVNGTVLWSKTYQVPDISYKCNSSTQATWHSSYTRNYLASQMTNVYVTEIPGIGIRMKWPSNSSNSWLPGNSGAAISCSTGCSLSNTTVLLEFIQIGNLNAGENYIPEGKVAEASVIPVTDPGEKLSILTINFGTAIKVVPRTCAIYPSSNYIDLGTYSVAEFINDKEKQGEKKDFTITVACPSTSVIGLQIDSLGKIPFGATGGVIGVESGEGYASNFAIRLFVKSGYAYTALNIGKSYTFTASPTITRNYQAQIYVPESLDRTTQLTAGQVVGVIVYTMKIEG